MMRNSSKKGVRSVSNFNKGYRKQANSSLKKLYQL